MSGTVTAAGIAIPKLGLGTGQLRGAAGQAAMEQALALGYRHLDTAEMYTNEAQVGAALAASGLARQAVHVTTKMLPEHNGPEELRRSLERSLVALRTSYVDLYLIHWPNPAIPLAATLEAMIRAREAGLVRAIGVSNFPVALLRQAVESIGAPIAANQVEYHLLLDQSAVRRYASAHAIAVIAYAPLARGAFHGLPEVQRIAAKHGASTAQIGLRWLLEQDGVAAIPRAGRRETQLENLQTATIALDDEDRAALARLPKDRRVVQVEGAPVWDPVEATS